MPKLRSGKETDNKATSPQTMRKAETSQEPTKTENSDDNPNDLGNKEETVQAEDSHHNEIPKGKQSNEQEKKEECCVGKGHEDKEQESMPETGPTEATTAAADPTSTTASVTSATTTPATINLTPVKEQSNQPQEEPQGEPQGEPHQQQKIIPYNYFVVTLSLLAVLALAVAVVIGPDVFPYPSSNHSSPIQHHIPRVKMFSNKLEKMTKSFPNQTKRFWSMINKTSLAHLEMENPDKPLVILLSGPPSAHNVINCIAKKLAEILDHTLKHSDFISGTKFKEMDGHFAKQLLDDELEKLLSNGHKSALVMNIETLPSPSPMIFYKFCDDENSAYKDVAILFTVHLPEEPDSLLKPVEAEGEVEKYLKGRVWKGPPYKEDDIQPLMSRITETVALVRGEKQDTVNRECAASV